MIETMSLNQAVAKAFNASDAPEFNQTRPVLQAQEWLKSKDVSTRFDKAQVRKGIVAFTNGGNVLYAVVDDKESFELPRNAQVLGSLSVVETAATSNETPKNEKKSRKSTKKDENASESE